MENVDLVEIFIGTSVSSEKPFAEQPQYIAYFLLYFSTFKNYLFQKAAYIFCQPSVGIMQSTCDCKIRPI